MEDAHTCRLALGLPGLQSVALFGVFDGHSADGETGKLVAQKTARALEGCITAEYAEAVAVMAAAVTPITTRTQGAGTCTVGEATMPLEVKVEVEVLEAAAAVVEPAILGQAMQQAILDVDAQLKETFDQPDDPEYESLCPQCALARPAASHPHPTHPPLSAHKSFLLHEHVRPSTSLVPCSLVFRCDS